MRKAVAVGLLAVAGATAGIVALTRDDASDQQSVERTAATLVPPADDALRIVLDDGAPRTTDGLVDVFVDAPVAASDNASAEVQIDVDPTFSDAPWLPLDSSHTIRLNDGGYQMVFARIRTSPNGQAGPTAVAGIEVDTTWSAATASDGGDPHRASWARLVAPDVLKVRIEAGRMVWNGASPDDLVIGGDLDTVPLDAPETYRLGPADAPTITAVSRVSRPNGQATFGDQRVLPMIHDLYLQLDQPLPLGTEIELTFDADVESIEFTVDDSASISPAVHVNQVGYRPNDDGKVALISEWQGEAGGVVYADAMAFQVIDVSTGASVVTGTTTRRPDSDDEFGKGDVTGAEVHEADFSAVADQGRYRLCVNGLGCSETFAISDDSTWRRAAVAVARSAYHQRSGVALGQPFTSVDRPRPFHPDDGVTFEQTTLTMIDDPADIGRDDRFDEYPANVTGDTLTDAWGGHFDAGDWNSRVQHLAYLSMALDLVRLYPDAYARLDVDLPESGNAVPDLIDEGLWDLELYRRLQHDDGGVPGSVDQGRFGTADESSWDNTTGVYVFAPDVWSTYVYAGVAAQAATVLRAYDIEASDRYAESAGRAMGWAEAAWAKAAPDEALRVEVDRQRAVAAAAMLELTGDGPWNDVLGAASTIDEGAVELLDCDGPQCSAAWIYARIDPSLTRPDWQRNAIDSIVANAEAALAGQASTSFAWVMERPDIPMVWGLGPSIPHGVGLLRAYVLTGDDRYRTAMVRAASFSLGANPLNTSFATGLGANPARYPLVGDSIKQGLPVWPGTFQYGIHDLSFSPDDDWVDEFVLAPAGVEPPAGEVPLLWSWYDAGTLPMMNEFTVTQSHAVALWTLGVLAAT